LIAGLAHLWFVTVHPFDDRLLDGSFEGKLTSSTPLRRCFLNERHSQQERATFEPFVAHRHFRRA